jgi:diguanylate cyclase (GGDEF)-like protein
MNSKSFNSTVRAFFNKGALPGDSDDMRLKKAILTLISSIIAVLAIFWGTLYAVSGYSLSGAIPLSYAVISFLSIAYYFKTKKFAFFRFSQLSLILLLPFLLMWSLGGFANGSVVMVWAFFAPLAALFFSGLKSASRWLLAFVAMTIISGLINARLEELVPPMSGAMNNLYFIMNMGFGFVSIYIVIYFFVKDREASHHAAVRAKEEALQAKNDLESAYEQLQKNEERIRELMLTDSLTAVANRRYLDERLAHEMRRMERYGFCFSIIMTDLDFFKRFNDTYGHTAGDAVLVTFAKVLQDNVRSTDFVARFGGEEFVVLLPETDEAGAVHFAERIRKAMEQTRIEGIDEVITASFGVTTVSNTEPLIAVLKRVDRALYQSKQNGRNQVTYTPQAMKPCA